MKRSSSHPRTSSSQPKEKKKTCDGSDRKLDISHFSFSIIKLDLEFSCGFFPPFAIIRNYKIQKPLPLILLKLIFSRFSFTSDIFNF